MASAGHAGAPTFRDRRDAGRLLASQLSSYADRTDVVVLGLPRGGVPVAYEVARSLALPLDALLVRKLGVPRHEELAFGAIATGGVRVLNPDVVAETALSSQEIERIAARQTLELDRREQLYRQGKPQPELRGRTAILVDDGLATGATMRAAVEAVHGQDARAVVAVPVAPAQTCAQLAAAADAVVCPLAPEHFVAVGLWYGEFSPTGDEEVRQLLARAWAR